MARKRDRENAPSARGGDKPHPYTTASPDTSGDTWTPARVVARALALAGRYRFSAWLFLRLLGLVYLVAFLSLSVQVEGLIGSHGILPVERWLADVRAQLGGVAPLQVPTLLWLASSDTALTVLCGLGIGFAVLLLLGVFETPALLALWLLYLSFTAAGQTFLRFQWDSLLLEVGFLALFLARPRLGWSWRPGRRLALPSPLGLFLVWWLLFRFMVASGAVKLSSGDETWWSLAALRYHYETQPLPIVLGWLAHQLPAWLQSLSVVLMFAIELLVPVLIVCGVKARRVAFAVLVGFQLLIAATGNYTFFNLLTIALCVTLLDDAVWPAAVKRRFGLREPAAASPARGLDRPWRALRVTYALAVVPVSLLLLGSAVGLVKDWPRPGQVLYRALSSFDLVNPYGLFAVMTTERLEIEVEGSADGVTWRPYVFRYKPGDPGSHPRLVAPHQPRLDWQMWFAALGTWRQNPWFVLFLARLAEGSPPVLALLAENPFPDQPPRFLRARLWDYRFTDIATWRRTGDWWRREARGDYFPAVSAEQLLPLLRPPL